MLLRGGPDDPEREPFVTASPFLTFAVAVEQVAADLREATYVSEWVGPRQRLPLLGGDDLRELLDDRPRRAFLAALLASYTRVASGTVWRETPRGWRRQRFSELDPVRLALTLDVLPESRHPAVHRRLGDLSLFLAGVFPDHTAGARLPPDRAAAPGAGGGRRRPGRRGAGRGARDARRRRACSTSSARAGTASRRAPRRAAGASTRLLEAIAERFVQARRALNLLADRHLFPSPREWFPAP